MSNVNITLQNEILPSFSVTDVNGKAVPTSGYGTNVVLSNTSVLSVGSNPLSLNPLTEGVCDVNWTVFGKGAYSGAITLVQDVVNVNPIPLANASVGYTVQ